MGLRSRIKRGWRAFLGRDAPETFYPTSEVSYGPSFGIGGYRIQSVSYRRGANASRVIKNRIANDAAQIKMVHSIVDEDGDYQATRHTPLNKVLTIRANIDQPATSFREDIYESLLEEGGIAIVPTLIDDELEDPENDRRKYEICEARVAKVLYMHPEDVHIEIYNEVKGQHMQYTIPKSECAVIENPFRSIMNDANSTAKQLERKIALLDRIDDQMASGKLDLIIQLPYPLKGQKAKDDANRRRNDINDQLEGTKYGIAYIDSSEKIVQLNRPLENNLLQQIEYYEKRLYTELGVTPEIMNGTADENAMANYSSRVVEPIVNAVAESLRVSFLSTEAIDDGQSISYFRDPFKGVSVTTVASTADSFRRNEIMTTNEIRSKLGLKPSSDERANKLENPNLNHPDEAGAQNAQAAQEEPPM